MPKRKTQAESDDEFLMPSTSHRQVNQGNVSTSASRKRAKPSPPRSAGDNTAKSKRPEIEKRLAREKKACPMNIVDRVYRVQTQRFFMIDRQREQGEPKETFKVLGSTGNVYTVIVAHVPSCDCPDARKGNHCKHILFVFLKVLGQNSATSTYYYQKALLTSELEDLFAHAPASPQHVLSSRATQAYKQVACGDPQTEQGDCADEATQGKRRLPSEGDACPVCYEDLEPGQTEGLVFCSHSCGGGLHIQCFRQWSAASATSATCVYCRAPWPGAAPGSSSSTAFEEGYTNLASEAGVSRERDTSTYHPFNNSPGRRRSRGFFM